jgi:hypothetical protein
MEGYFFSMAGINSLQVKGKRNEEGGKRREERKWFILRDRL